MMNPIVLLSESVEGYASNCGVRDEGCLELYYLCGMSIIAFAAWVWLFVILLTPVLRSLWQFSIAEPPVRIQFSLSTLLALVGSFGLFMTLLSSPWAVRAFDIVCWAVMLIVAHASFLFLLGAKRNTVRDIAAQRLRFRKQHVVKIEP